MRPIHAAALTPVLMLGVLLASPAGTARAATPFDGTYRGGNTLAGGGGMRCAAAQTFSIVVRDGTFTWVIGSERETVKVGPDGSFAGQSGARFISGRIAGQTMTASTSGTACNYTWSLTR